MTVIRKNDHTLGDLIRVFTQDKRMKPHLMQKKLENAWLEMMGPYIHRETHKIRINKRTLILAVHSAALRQELHYISDKLKDRVNELFEEDYIEKVVVR